MAIQLNSDAFVSGWIYCYKTLYVSVGITLVARETGGQLTGVNDEIGITSSGETCVWFWRVDFEKQHFLGRSCGVKKNSKTGSQGTSDWLQYQNCHQISKSGDNIIWQNITLVNNAAAAAGITRRNITVAWSSWGLFSSTSHLVSVESCLRFFTGILALGRLFIRNHHDSSFFLGKRSEGRLDENNLLKALLVKFVGSWRHIAGKVSHDAALFIRDTWVRVDDTSVSHDASLLIGDTWVRVDDGHALALLRQLSLLPREPLHLLCQLPGILHCFTLLVKAQVKLC